MKTSASSLKVLSSVTVFLVLTCNSNAKRFALASPKHSIIFGLRTRSNLLMRGGSSTQQQPLKYATENSNSTEPENGDVSASVAVQCQESFKIDLETRIPAEIKREPLKSSIAHYTNLNPTSDPDAEYKKALQKTALTVAAAGLFGIGIMAMKGASSGYEFYAGYLIEQSLSIDNLFVFIMLFDYFKVPINLQNRVLSWGITGAIALRGLMIGVGVAALQQFRSVILVFAGILIASSINLLLESDHDDSSASEENFIMKLSKFIFPNTSSDLHGEDFFVISKETGKMIATPLFLCLVCVELSDFVFAVDSIPAVLGVSKDPLIVYASNIFAIMALRSLYTVVAKAVSKFHYLKPAVALVLGFVGSKMVGEYFHYEIGTGVSLAVICTLLGGGVGASILENKKRQQIK